MSSSFNVKTPKPKDDHLYDVLSLAGAGGDKPKAQVPASRWVYEVDSDDDMIMDYRIL
jgi:hypothetical protein